MKKNDYSNEALFGFPVDSIQQRAIEHAKNEQEPRKYKNKIFEVLLHEEARKILLDRLSRGWKHADAVAVAALVFDAQPPENSSKTL